ncbi:MAG TPA: matrixin family metalloprotease [Candidatus Obscuribacterales bacterium]|nr:matrixin family metalloprotease [Candidatus Obscuribacterales bacterium]
MRNNCNLWRRRTTRELISLFLGSAMIVSGLTYGCQIKVQAEAKKTKEDPTVTEARALIEGGKVSDAESKLAAALRGNLANDSIRCLHADTLYRLGRYHFAADEIKVVLTNDPNNAEAILLSGKIFQSMHHPTEAVEAYKKFQAMKPEDPRSQQYGALISVLESEAKNALQRKNAQSSGDDYLAAVAGSNLLKWKIDKPITVYVKDGTSTPGYRTEYEESLRQAFDEWTQATNGKIKFAFIQDPGVAQMSVVWTDDLHAPAMTAEAGVAKTAFGANGIETAEISLLTLDPLKDGPLGKNRLFNTCLHEIGHALGLQGHSPHEDDIMSSTLIVQQGLSPRDVRTINALYADNSTAEKRLPDKDEYGRPLSPAVLCQRHVQEGSVAAGNNQFEKAIAEFEAALKIDSKQERAREGLAIAFNNMAIEKDTSSEKSIELFRKALYWDPTCDVARGNLNSYLQSTGVDPKSFDARVKLAEGCLKKNDVHGAIVEYTEALIYKADDAVKKKLDTLQKKQ